MNLFDVLNRGAALAPKPPEYTAQQLHAVEAARRQWLNALLVDQTRAWLSLGEKQPEVLTAMDTMLTIAVLVDMHATGTADSPAQRVMRGAVSAATQCAQGGSLLRTADAKAFAAACRYADIIIRNAKAGSIIYAAEGIRKTVGL